jgi:hypothetical protein
MSIVLDGTAGITTPDLTDTSLTSGRVVYAGTGGNLTGASTFVFDGTNLGLGTASPTGISGRKTQVIRGTTSEVLLQSSTATDGTNEGITVTAAGADAYYVNRLAGAHIWTGGSGGNSERMRINAGAPILCLSGGNTSATGTGIAFPATQSASSDANTLDDYEEGTFTPTVLTEFGSATTGGQTSVYTKVGNIVNVCGSFNIATISSPSGLLRVGNLPFTVATIGVNGVNASASLWNTASSYASLTPWVYTFSGQPQFYIRFTNGTSATEGAGLLKVGTEIWFNVTYRVS